MGVPLQSLREQVFKEQEASALCELAPAQFVFQTIHGFEGAVQGFGDLLGRHDFSKVRKSANFTGHVVSPGLCAARRTEGRQKTAGFASAGSENDFSLWRCEPTRDMNFS